MSGLQTATPQHIGKKVTFFHVRFYRAGIYELSARAQRTIPHRWPGSPQTSTRSARPSLYREKCYIFALNHIKVNGLQPGYPRAEMRKNLLKGFHISEKKYKIACYAAEETLNVGCARLQVGANRRNHADDRWNSPFSLRVVAITWCHQQRGHRSNESD